MWHAIYLGITSNTLFWYWFQPMWCLMYVAELTYVLYTQVYHHVLYYLKMNPCLSLSDTRVFKNIHTTYHMTHHMTGILTNPKIHLSSLIVPQQPQNASSATSPPPPNIRYVAISNRFEPMTTDHSRALKSVTNSHTPTATAPTPIICKGRNT